MKENARFLLLLLLLAVPLSAHPDPGHTLEEIEEHLRETPDDPALLRRKADVFLSAGHPREAAPVIARLLVLAPDDPETRLLEARQILDTGGRKEARAKARSLVSRAENFAPGWNFLARVEDESGNRDAAITAKRRYLDLTPRPGASDVMACAAWLQERDKPGDALAALAVLDQGIARLGCLSGLQHAAIAIELPLSRHDSALRRIDALSARFRPSVDLALRRVEILEQAGRYDEAAAACDAALGLLDALPDRRKASPQHRARVDALARRKERNLARALHNGVLKPAR